MSEPEIKRKLAHVLNHVRTEQSAVYALVLVRKLVELRRHQRKPGHCFALTFYCDWAVHPLMTREGAKRIISQFNDYYRAKANGESEEMNTVWEIMGLKDFQKQLRELLLSEGLKTDICDDKKRWVKFLHFYSGIIADTPLLIEGHSSEFVKQITVTKARAPGTLRRLVKGQQVEFMTSWKIEFKSSDKPEYRYRIFTFPLDSYID